MSFVKITQITIQIMAIEPSGDGIKKETSSIPIVVSLVRASTQRILLRRQMENKTRLLKEKLFNNQISLPHLNRSVKSLGSNQ